MGNQKTKFIYQPEYPGGPKALMGFIYQHLQYPEAALALGLEGIVNVEYDVDYKGKVIDARILQGLGHGCDEEALRVVRLLKFDVPTNRGVKVLFHKKINIQFKRPVVQTQPAAPAPAQMQLTYTITTPTPTTTPEPAARPVQETYSYVVQF